MPGSGSGEPRTTIAVVPRESYSMTATMLDTLLDRTPAPRRIVLVDGGSPRRVWRRLARLASECDFTFVHRDAVITSNEARNEAMRHVETEYVCFLDNDTIVDDGWLTGLERCADETGAALVVAAVIWGRRDHWEIHYAGGSCRIVSDGPTRRFDEHNSYMHRPVGALAELTRTRTEYVEEHCLLARVDVLRRIGPFDEALLAAREHSTLSLQVTAMGAEIWLEPSVVVRYPWPKRNTLADYRFYLPRWSDAWAEPSFRRFNDTWQLTDTEIDNIFRQGHRERRLEQRPASRNGLRGRTRPAVLRARAGLDRVVTPLAVGACERRRARAGPARVLHRGSWDTA
ncbi:MAG: glycosyltransferase family 2 protein [Acidimicrobiia bacterium]